MLLSLLLAGCSAAPEAPDDPMTLRSGTWHAWLEGPGGPVPFSLELIPGNRGWQAAIGNGDERIPIDAVHVDAQAIALELAPYDATLQADLRDEGARLDGTWTKARSDGRTEALPFHAELGGAPRFDPLRVVGEPASVAGRWAAEFESGPAVGVFEQAGTSVQGTFLTPLGDYRYLAGSVEGRALRLSTFDGAHAFLFTATATDDGLRGDFWSGSTWHETWMATLDPGASLPDPTQLTRPSEQVDWTALSFPDVDGRTRSLADPEWADSPRLVQIMGSWCPNCNDQTELLVELYREHRAEGLQIVSIAFEHDPGRAAGALKRYRAHHGVEWVTLIGGLSSKDEASEALPFLDRVRAYPTLLFVARTGEIRAVWTGFSGPAAPREHRALRAAWDREIAALLQDS